MSEKQFEIFVGKDKRQLLQQKAILQASQNIFQSPPQLARLDKLKTDCKHIRKVLNNFSINLHYEIFQFLDYKDLVTIKILNLGGYQFIANLILRSRYQKYIFPYQNIDMTKVIENNNLFIIERKARVKFLVEEIYGMCMYWTKIRRIAIFIQILRELFEELPRLEKLILICNNLDSTQLLDIFRKFPNISGLQSLTIREQSFRVKTAIEFSGHLASIPKLRTLNLGGNYLDHQAICAITNQFKHIPFLRELILDTNSLRLEGTVALAHNLGHIPHLEILSLNSCTVSLGKLVELLDRVPDLIYLSLNHNKFAVITTSDSVNSVNGHIEDLDSFISLINILKKMKSLQKLYLNNMDLNDLDAKYLAHSFTEMQQLVNLEILQNHFSDEAKEILMENKKNTLKKLELFKL